MSVPFPQVDASRFCRRSVIIYSSYWRSRTVWDRGWWNHWDKPTYPYTLTCTGNNNRTELSLFLLHISSFAKTLKKLVHAIKTHVDTCHFHRKTSYNVCVIGVVWPCCISGVWLKSWTCCWTSLRLWRRNWTVSRTAAEPENSWVKWSVRTRLNYYHHIQTPTDSLSPSIYQYTSLAQLLAQAAEVQTLSNQVLGWQEKGRSLQQ